MKILKNNYLIRSQLSLIVALPLTSGWLRQVISHILCQSPWGLLSNGSYCCFLSIFVISYLFFSGWLSKTSNQHAPFFSHNLADILTVWKRWASPCSVSKHVTSTLVKTHLHNVKHSFGRRDGRKIPQF